MICDICNTKLVSKRCIKDYKIEVKTKFYKCPKCKREFQSMYSLTRNKKLGMVVLINERNDGMWK